MDTAILEALTRLRLSGCRFSDRNLADDIEPLFAVYIDGMHDLPRADVVEACRRWPTIPERGKWWPALEELRALADDIACESRMRDAPPLPRPDRAASRRPDRVTIADPARMRRDIADMRANPGKYIAAQHFAAIGEMMLARWEAQQQAERRMEPA